MSFNAGSILISPKTLETVTGVKATKARGRDLTGHTTLKAGEVSPNPTAPRAGRAEAIKSVKKRTTQRVTKSAFTPRVVVIISSPDPTTLAVKINDGPR